MPRYALLLRGVNVGTKNSLPMATFRALLTELGCTAVTTYIQSGNAVFGSTLDPATLTERVERALADVMGRPIATTLRTLEELTLVVSNNPFREFEVHESTLWTSSPRTTVPAKPAGARRAASEFATNGAKLCVTFLSQPPADAELQSLQGQDWTPERWQLRGRELYSWYPNGQGRSPLATALGKAPLRGTVTTRNWNTVLKLLELLSDA